MREGPVVSTAPPLGVRIPASPSRDLLGPNLPGRAGKAALVHDGRETTFEELRSTVSRLARGLRERFAPGDLLALWLPNGPEILGLTLACLKTGIVPVPMHRGMRWPEVRAVLDRSLVAGMVAASDALGLAAADLGRTGVRHVFAVGNGRASGSLAPYEELTRNDGDVASDRLPPDRVALVLHTSGTEGRAKGVMLSAASLDHVLAYRLAHTALGPDSVSVVASCLTQSVGLYQSLALIAAGGTLVLLESYDVDRMVASVHRHEPTHLVMVVDAWDRLLHDPRITPESFRRLAFASVGADRVTARVQERFRALTGRPLRVSYGLTESSWVLVNPGDRVDKCLALGKPCPGIEVRIVDGAGSDVPEGSVGEIHVRSPRTMLGYLGDPRATGETLVDGWLATGDLARRDQEGYVWFAGRTKNLIVLATGDNVSPVEVENAIASHPSVARCAVAGAATEHGSAEPWAYVVRRDASLSAEILLAFLRERLSDVKVPRRIVFVAELPVGATGKVRLADGVLAANGTAGASAPPGLADLVEPTT